MHVNKNSSGGDMGKVGIKLLQFLIAVIIAVSGVVAGYVTTIYGIKLDLADKADVVAVTEMDKKLTQIEIILQEKLLTKDDFYQFREELDRRLDSIEKRIDNR